MDEKTLKVLRTKTAEQIANEIVNVQPMPSDIINKLIQESMNESDLIEQGYEPVEKCGLSLMWVKK